MQVENGVRWCRIEGEVGAGPEVSCWDLWRTLGTSEGTQEPEVGHAGCVSNKVWSIHLFKEIKRELSRATVMVIRIGMVGMVVVMAMGWGW